MVVENSYIYGKVTIAVDAKHALGKEIIIFRVSIGSQSHDLPLVAGEHVKSQEVCNSRVELSQRMREFDAFKQFDPCASPTRQRGRRILTRAIHRQYCGAVKW